MAEEKLDIKMQAVLSQATTEFNRLTSAAKNFDSSMVNVIQKFDMIKRTTTTITTSADGMKRAILTVDEHGNKLKQTFSDLSDSGKKVKKSTSDIFDLNKLYLYWNLTKKLRDNFKKIITSAIDFNETQNKFNVSMGTAEKDATNFVNTITEAVGIGKAELMDYQSTYKNILAGLGSFSDQQSEIISESLVKMALDYSSLFNVDRTQSMNKFQAALTGSIRPIRSDSGFDISEQTIGEKAKELGLDRTVGQLTQMEKRILRIIVLMDQMKNTGAFNDLARTIEEPANQLKVLQDQIQEVGIWLGNVFMGTLGAILPYVNAFVMTIKELIKMFAAFVGFKSATSGLEDAFDVAEDAAGGIAGGIGSANKNAKELKKTLMGFDVLNVITTPKESKGGGGGGVGSIDPKILGSLKEYDSLMENVRMKATDIRDRIMEWLGFTKIIDPLTGEISWYLNEGYQKIELIKDAIVGIGAAFAAWAIIKNWKKIKEAFDYIRLLFSEAGIFYNVGKIGTTVAGFFGITVSGIGAVATGLGVLAIAVAGIVALYKGWKWATDEAIGSTDKLAGTSEDTVQRLVPVQKAFDDLVTTINDVSYDGLALTPEEEEKIISSIDTLTAQLRAALQDYTDESVRQLNYLYYEAGLITEEEYKDRLKKIEEYHKKESEEIDKQSEKLKVDTKNLYDESGNIRMDAYAEWLMNLEKFETRSLEVLTVSEDDKKKIMEGADKKTLEEKKKYYADLFTGYAEDRDKAITTAEEKYNKTVEYAKNTYGESSAEYQALQEKAKQIYDQEVLDAQKKYDDLYTELETSQTEIADYIDKDTGNVKKNWEVMWDNMSKTAETELGNGQTKGETFINGLSTAFSVATNPSSGIMLAVKAFARGITNIFQGNLDLRGNFSIGGTGSGGGFAGGRADGGPVPTGQLFVAREAGPELVGQIGRTTAVMNNQQIVQAVSQGVATAVANVMGNNRGNGPIQVILDGREIASATRSGENRLNNIFGTV